MAFSLSFAGVRVTIAPSPPSPGDGGRSIKDEGGGGADADGNGSFCITGVRHCADGRVEADVVNFSGTVTISSDEASTSSTASSSNNAEQNDENNDEERVASRDVIVDAIPEPLTGSAGHAACANCSLGNKVGRISSWLGSSFNAAGAGNTHPSMTNQDDITAGAGGAHPNLTNHDHDDMVVDGDRRRPSHLTAGSNLSEPYVPSHSQDQLTGLQHEISHQLTVEIDSGDEENNKVQSPPESGHGGGGVRFGATEIIQDTTTPDDEGVDLALHRACGSDEVEMDELFRLLRSNPELASVEDRFGDYPAHVFANNDAFIYTDDDESVRRFAYELYGACPAAFLTEGYDGQIPFVGTITDWVDDCHVLYARDGKQEVRRVSEIKTLTKSTRVSNSLCVREEVQRMVHLPTNVALPPRVVYSFAMLSFLLDKMTESAFEDVSVRREFWTVANKRRDKIVGSVASVPFVVRTILLIENKAQRDALIDLSVVRNLLFRPESVDLWLVALLSGGERARNCAKHYLCLISSSSLSKLFGDRRVAWGESDRRRFHAMRGELYEEVRRLKGFLPCMLNLGDDLYVVARRRAVKYAVEGTIGRPLPVYLMFMEMIILLVLMTTYRIIVELVYDMPIPEFLSRHRDLWGLAFSISVYFAMRDIAITVSFWGTADRLAGRYATGFGNFIGFVSIACTITVLTVMYTTSSIKGRNFVGIVSGLLWWKFLLMAKGMSENLATLVYTIMQIAATLKYFLLIFAVGIFFFADMIDIVKKTSGDCDHIYQDGEMDSDLETFCSLTPLQTYLAMYGVMIGGFEIGALEGSSALVALLFVAASFCGVIILVNILIAIVTSEYEKAREQSCIYFARARLEAAARQVARESILDPPDDPTSGIGRKLWRISGKFKYLALVGVIEYFLIKSLIACSSLHRDGLVGHFLFVALILCAILYHIFAVAVNMYLVARAICKRDSLKWLRGSKLHIGMLNICLKPVCRYLTSVGLGKGEACPDASDMEEKDHPLSHNEFLGKQADFENHIQEAMRASETRILHAVKSMIMFQMSPE